MKDQLWELTSRRRSVSMICRIDRLNAFIRGWMSYFALADLGRRLRDVDEWLRRRMRQTRWKEWKRYPGQAPEPWQVGIPDAVGREWAASSKGYWRIARSPVLQRALSNTHWDDLGRVGYRAPVAGLKPRLDEPPGMRARMPGGVRGG
ncbi:group II intron maturase-specific domain-containing protein [Nonomuraea sp. NPDC046802]|uniref:group II intron maturase-specific domain-containing protein n=1 Tax=Nonomuraea sp. NPDC046802 TaxID=3154919 RepID=UPI0033F9A16D